MLFVFSGAYLSTRPEIQPNNPFQCYAQDPRSNGRKKLFEGWNARGDGVLIIHFYYVGSTAFAFSGLLVLSLIFMS